MSEPLTNIEALQDFYESLPETYRLQDANQDYALKRYLSGVLRQFDLVRKTTDLISYDSNDESGPPTDTSILADPARIPSAWLIWRAQFTSLLDIQGLPVVERRNALLSAAVASQKGTSKSIIEAVRTVLVGSRYVRLMPKTITASNPGAGTIWDLLIITKTSETLQNNVPLPFAGADVPQIWTASNGAVGWISDSDFYDSNALTAPVGTNGSFSFYPDYTKLAQKITVSGGNTHSFFIALKTNHTSPLPGQIVVRQYNSSDTLVATTTQPITVGLSKAQHVLTVTTNAAATYVTFTVESTGTTVVPAGRSIIFGEIGARLGSITTWILKSVDIPAVLEAANVKPAGITIRTETYEATWAQIESGIPNWNTWDTLTWDQIEENGI